MVLDLSQTVAAENFQPYLSAVNKAHEHLELDKPAVGERVSSTRKSIAADAVKITVEPQRETSFFLSARDGPMTVMTTQDEAVYTYRFWRRQLSWSDQQLRG
jgi:hypothetical protein